MRRAQSEAACNTFGPTQHKCIRAVGAPRFTKKPKALEMSTGRVRLLVCLPSGGGSVVTGKISFKSPVFTLQMTALMETSLIHCRLDCTPVLPHAASPATWVWCYKCQTELHYLPFDTVCLGISLPQRFKDIIYKKFPRSLKDIKMMKSVVCFSVFKIDMLG